MKSRSLHSSTKKGFLIFLIVTWQPFMKHHSPASFPSHNITRNAETHPPPMRDVIIEQPLYQTIDWNVWGVVQQEIAESNSNSKYFAALFRRTTLGDCFYYISFCSLSQPQPQNVTLDLVFFISFKHFRANNVDHLHVAISGVPRQLVVTELIYCW